MKKQIKCWLLVSTKRDDWETDATVMALKTKEKAIVQLDRKRKEAMDKIKRSMGPDYTVPAAGRDFIKDPRTSTDLKWHILEKSFISDIPDDSSEDEISFWILQNNEFDNGKFHVTVSVFGAREEAEKQRKKELDEAIMICQTTHPDHAFLDSDSGIFMPSLHYHHTWEISETSFGVDQHEYFSKREESRIEESLVQNLLRYFENQFEDMESSFTNDVVENLIRYGLDHENKTKDQFVHFLWDMIPGLDFGEIASFLCDGMLSEQGKKEKTAFLEKEEKTLMQLLLDAGYPKKDMFHCGSDLYVYVDPISKPIVEAYYKEHGRNHLPVFQDRLTGELMYDCAFLYDDYWAQKRAAENE